MMIVDRFQRFAGERTLKISGVPESQLVNGRSVQTTRLQNGTLYASPFWVASTQNGYCTKHYYAGSERVAYRISGGGVSTLNRCLDAQADFNKPESAVNPYLLDPSETPPYFFEKMQQNTTALVNTMRCLGQKIATTASSAGVLRPNQPFQLVRQFEQVQNADQGLSFYHTDHLGSSAWITDHLGRGIQHFLYLPFGEPWIDQQNSGFHTYFTFSGKERDPETGYGYFGARYYSSDLSIWLSVDPMAAQRPWSTSYSYCQNNPVGRVDPRGEIDFPLKGNYAVNKKDYANGAWGLANAIVRTSLYQERRNIGTSPHIGIDYRASVGTPVYSFGDGIVNDIGTMKNGIKYITIEYGNGDKLRFLHMDKIADDMNVGGKVYEGQIIGDAGNSGQYKAKDGAMKNYTPHLHVDAKDRNGNSINPEQNNYGTIDNKTFFDQFNGDHRKLYQYKQESIQKLHEAGGGLE